MLYLLLINNLFWTQLIKLNNMSKRQERKLARNAKASRPNRRAANRLSSATAGYEAACKVAGKAGAVAYTKPGAQKHW